MGTQRGIHPYTNKVGGSRGYQISGDKKHRIFISGNGGADKATFDTKPSMVNNRNNASEFGGACTQGKNTNAAIQVVLPLSMGHFLGRINKVNVQIIKLGSGPAGQRTWDLSLNRSYYLNIPVNDIPFQNVAKFSGNFIHASHSSIFRWNYILTNQGDIKYPFNSQYFRYFLIVFTKSDAAYDPTAKVYYPVAPSHDLIFAPIQYSAWHANNFSGSIIDNLATVIPITPNLGTDSIIAICGIQFANLIGGSYQILTTNEASSILYCNN